MQINRLNATTDPEFLIMKVTLRRENDENVVDMAVEILKDIGTNAFVRNIMLGIVVHKLSGSFILHRLKVRYLFVKKVKANTRAS